LNSEIRHFIEISMRQGHQIALKLSDGVAIEPSSDTSSVLAKVKELQTCTIELHRDGEKVGTLWVVDGAADFFTDDPPVVDAFNKAVRAHRRPEHHYRSVEKDK